MFDLNPIIKKESFEIPKIMGILNATPDSFSDGGNFIEPKAALEHAKQMIDEGADIIDVGGESTRPGAEVVSEEIEQQRVLPIIEGIRKFSNIDISIDTSNASTMMSAKNSGATLINDVYALQKDRALETANQLNLPVCLMHMQGNPKTMQDKPKYDNVVDEVINFFRHRLFDCQSNGLKLKDIIIDPGFGFGKTVEQNFQMLSQLEEFKKIGAPILVGISRKSMLGAITAAEVTDRLGANISAAVIAAMKGANILRVHDVKETHQALAVLKQL